MLINGQVLNFLQNLTNRDFLTQFVYKLSTNPKKSKNSFFGKGSTPSCEIKIEDETIPWVDKWVYLGVTLMSGPTFGCCVKETLGKFYRALNSILRVEGRSDEMVMLRLIEEWSKL